MFALLLALSTADAADLSGVPGGSEPARLAASGDRERGGSGQPSGAKSGGKSGGKSGDAQAPRWEGSWYATPSAGATIYGSGATSVGLGGSAGYKYSLVNTPPPTWSGKTRVAAAYSTNSGGLQGLDLRLGSFIGPSWKDLALQIGPDLFWNQVLNASVDTLDPSTGLELPLSASLRLSPLTLSAGVAPAWLSKPSRRVDWDTVDSALPGFGDEFVYRAGVGLTIEGFSVSGSYSYRIVSTGVQQGFAFGVKI